MNISPEMRLENYASYYLINFLVIVLGRPLHRSWARIFAKLVDLLMMMTMMQKKREVGVVEYSRICSWVLSKFGGFCSELCRVFLFFFCLSRNILIQSNMEYFDEWSGEGGWSEPPSPFCWGRSWCVEICLFGNCAGNAITSGRKHEFWLHFLNGPEAYNTVARVPVSTGAGAVAVAWALGTFYELPFSPI